MKRDKIPYMNINKLIETFKSNALPFWYASLFLSLLIFSIYFVEIQYFPIKSYDSLIAVSLFVSFVFLIVIFFLTLLLLLSSHLQKRLISNQRICTIIFGGKFYKTFHRIIKKEKYRTIERKIFFKLIITLLLYHIVNFIFLVILFMFIPPVAMIVTILLTVITAINLKHTNKGSKLVLILYITSTITTSNLVMACIVGIFLMLSNTSPLHQADYLILTISTYFCLLTYSTFTVIPLPKIKNRFTKPIIFTLLITILLAINGGLVKLPKLIIEYFRIGNIYQATISTNQTGCYLFKNKGLELDCKNNQSIILIPHVNILWRIDEYVISFRDINGHRRQLILNSSITPIYSVESTS